jgi:glycosidase
MKRYLSSLVLLVLFISPSLYSQTTDITGICTAPDAPEWLRHAVFYQIYPQTFFDSNGDGIGDLNGMIQKLDYVKSLGADAIWVNPFFDSPFNDAGYDIRDYYKVAPRYGTNDDARRFFEEAHMRGLKVIFDYVITYTAIDHPWFVESCKQDSNKYTNWYVWNDNVWKMEEGEFANRFIQGYARRNGNFMRNFYWSQPALNFGFGKPDPEKKWQLPTNHHDVLAMREELKKIFCYWMDMGADGIRADMAGALVKGSDVNGDTKKFWTEIRQIVREKYPQAFMVSEWSYPKDALDGAFHADFFHWFDGYNDLTQKESWRILNGYSEGHSFFDREGKGNIAYFLSNYMDQYNATKSKGYIILPLGNHDNARINVNRTPEDLEIIMAFGITMPGIPFIYYGNEIGMRELDNQPYVEGAYKPRAGARSPMQWTSEKNCGFSTAEPSKLYLPVDPTGDAPNVAAEEKEPNSLLNRVKKLIQLKHKEPALAAYSEFVPLYAKENTYPLVYARANGKDAILVILNPSGKSAKAEFTVSRIFKKLQLLSGKEITVTKMDKNLSIEIPGVTYAIYKLK